MLQVPCDFPGNLKGDDAMKAMIREEGMPVERRPLRMIDVPDPVPGPKEILNGAEGLKGLGERWKIGDGGHSKEESCPSSRLCRSPLG